MLHLQRLAREFFARLEKLDEMIAATVAEGRCRHCAGPLHQGNYQRKPRGGLMATAGEAFTRRHSLCCGRRGCRKRALPPSLRFLGRRVYLEVVVVLASVIAQVVATAREAVAASGVPLRTLRRWGCWWREVFPRLPTWAELRGALRAPTTGRGAASPIAGRASRRRSTRRRWRGVCGRGGAAAVSPLPGSGDERFGGRRIAFRDGSAGRDGRGVISRKGC
jgi:hypothetical protein